jgi:tRNA/tmRNA/rRNA uracil-C5-methylase (TrmA/RlmC/RlmD family)
MIVRTSWEDQLRKKARQEGMPPLFGPEALASMPYGAEAAFKKDLARTFLSTATRIEAEAMMRAPLPRAYRTTTRRRIIVNKQSVRLVHGDGADGLVSPLEPAAHGEIYRAALAVLSEPRLPLKMVANHLIVRGTYDEHVLILNVRHVDADVVRSARLLVKKVIEKVPSVKSAWLYIDPSGSRYYLEMDRPLQGMGAKKLHGDSAWRQTINERQYQIGVFSFTQVNLAMLPSLVSTVSEAADVKEHETVGDLYGGYGLFGAALASQSAGVITVDVDETTVANARYNIRRAGGKVTAISTSITPSAIDRKIPPANVLILDPPRAGTDKGVIAALAARKPRRVVELFCGPDEVRRSVDEWRAAGYGPVRAIPIDLFPGTLGLECLVVFEEGVIEPVRPKPTQTPRRSGERRGR